MKLIRMNLYGLAFFCGISLCSSQVLAVQISSKIDNQQISLGQSFTYTITADENLSNDALDIRPLFKDFIIGNLQITHPSTTETVWIIPLQPVAAGDVIIPALQIADTQSEPRTLNVIDGNTQSPSNDTVSTASESELIPPPHLIESQISTNTAYPNEIINYSVTLVKRADPENKPPIVPSVKELTIVPIGQPTEDKEIFADHYQETLTYQYILIPKTTGTINVPGFAIASDKTQKSGDQIIEIKPIPASFQGKENDWLPSEGITLEERWEPQTSYAKIGQPITRIITLTGINNTPEQLPSLALPELSNVRVYSDGQKSDQQLQNGMLVSQKTFKQVFVPEKNTAFVVPSLTLNWWNTISDRAQVATLDERKFQASVIKETKPVTVTTPSISKHVTASRDWHFIISKILITLGFSIAMTTPVIAVIWYNRKRIRARCKLNLYWQDLQHACINNNAMQTYQALLAWASCRWQMTFTNVEMLPFYSILKTELDSLQSACFSEETTSWNGKKLAQALRRVKKIQIKSIPSEARTDEFSY